VFLAAIDGRLLGTAAGRAIRSADSGLKWVSTGWHDPKQVIVYRAVLNVPLYVFGRMNDMRAEYHRFRNLAKRPKVLHIDRNWETSLPDLDPDSAKEAHRQKILRSHVINFAALLTSGRRAPDGNGDGGAAFVLRRNGSYELLNPTPPEEDGERSEAASVPLGATLSDAIARLPEVLEAEKVKFLPYQQMLRGVREGLSPQVLERITRLPFRWRQSREELQNQYGPSPTDEQKLRLKDYADAYNRLQEALTDLYDTLRNRSVEQKTLGGDDGYNPTGLSPAGARAVLDQSIKILQSFCDAWEAVENPESATTVGSDFAGLFRPLPEEELSAALKRLREAPLEP
jgi:hypothetical protein